MTAGGERIVNLYKELPEEYEKYIAEGMTQCELMTANECCAMHMATAMKIARKHGVTPEDARDIGILQLHVLLKSISAIAILSGLGKSLQEKDKPDAENK